MDEQIRTALDRLAAAAARAATATAATATEARAAERAAWLEAIEIARGTARACEARGYRAGWREEARIQAQRAARAARASKRATVDHQGREGSMFTAGIYEQADGVWQPVAWSRHRSARAAEAAARRYRRRILRDGHQQTGGAYSWSAWWSAAIDGSDLVRVGGSDEA